MAVERFAPAAGAIRPSRAGVEGSGREALVAGRSRDHNRCMTRATKQHLDRFPLISTSDLASAREATAKFWPKHTSDVLGPEDYALRMNRVLLGSVAVSYVECTSRIRVIPSEPSGDSALYVPLDGCVDIVPDGRELAGSPSRPLLRGAYRQTQFEASPIRCLVVDLPAATLAEAAAAADVPTPVHASIGGREATEIVRLVKRLAVAANRSAAVVALQAFAPQKRLVAVPEGIQRQERSLVEAIVNAASGMALPDRPARGEAGCDVDALKAWLASHAHRPVRIAELAKRAGLSPRTVERAFLRTGCTPLEYLRGVRLDLARRMLTEPTATLTVAEAAAAAGFRQLGRFAGEYRLHFGELPSQTLAKARLRRG
jgi:AraC-like DNA-binding protein